MTVGSLAEQTTAARVFTMASSLRGLLLAAHTSSTDVEIPAPPTQVGPDSLEAETPPQPPNCVTGFRSARTCLTVHTEVYLSPHQKLPTVVHRFLMQCRSKHASFLTPTSRDVVPESPCQGS
jgi:hypothetical protein